MATDPNSNAALEVSDQAEYINLLKNAPIMELADYAGVDIDTAVQMRVDAAVQDAAGKLNMEITARPVTPQGNLYGFASVKVGGIRIDDFKILADKDQRLFVGMPSKPDKTSTTGYRNTVFVDKDFKDDFNKAILSAHHDAVEVLMERTEKMRAAPPIADQMANAKKQADKHNAALPPKEKGAKIKGDRE